MLAALALIPFGLRGLAGPAPEAADIPAPSPEQRADPGAAGLPDAATAPLPATPAEAEQQQEAAAAAARERGPRELQGRLERRPDFVSEIEWQALQAVARRSADYDGELLRLVNNLRFNKQLEQWRAGTVALAPGPRRALGEQLLEAVPERVRQQEYSVPAAQKLQQELLRELEPDPAAREARQAAEAARLRGVLLREEGGVRRE
jgi:hypothetical protein